MAARPAAGPGAPSAAAAVSASAAGIPAEVRAVCAAVAAYWGKPDPAAPTTVRQLDSLVTPIGSDTAVHACVVQMDREHDPDRRPNAPPDTTAQRLGLALALTRGTGPGWFALFRYSADGPDGSDLAYQKGPVRCLVEQSWDGGDDSDSTYVPADWFKETTTCWSVPGGVSVSDTTPGGR